MAGARGERTIIAGEQEVVVLFTNRALAGVEQQLNRGVVGIVKGIIDGDSGMREVAMLLQAGMEAARRDSRTPGRPVSLDQAWAVMDTAGFSQVVTLVTQAVADVLAFTGDTAEETGDDDPNV